MTAPERPGDRTPPPREPEPTPPPPSEEPPAGEPNADNILSRKINIDDIPVAESLAREDWHNRYIALAESHNELLEEFADLRRQIAQLRRDFESLRADLEATRNQRSQTVEERNAVISERDNLLQEREDLQQALAEERQPRHRREVIMGAIAVTAVLAAGVIGYAIGRSGDDERENGRAQPTPTATALPTSTPTPEITPTPTPEATPTPIPTPQPRVASLEPRSGSFSPYSQNQVERAARGEGPDVTEDLIDVEREFLAQNPGFARNMALSAERDSDKGWLFRAAGEGLPSRNPRRAGRILRRTINDPGYVDGELMHSVRVVDTTASSNGRINRKFGTTFRRGRHVGGWEVRRLKFDKYGRARAVVRGENGERILTPLTTVIAKVDADGDGRGDFEMAIANDLGYSVDSDEAAEVGDFSWVEKRIKKIGKRISELVKKVEKKAHPVVVHKPPTRVVAPAPRPAAPQPTPQRIVKPRPAAPAPVSRQPAPTPRLNSPPKTSDRAIPQTSHSGSGQDGSSGDEVGAGRAPAAAGPTGG